MTHQPATGVWTIGGLARGVSATLVLQGRVTATGPQTNVARLSAHDQVDSNPANDQAEATVEEQTPFGDPAVTQTVSNAAPLVGETVTFTVTATSHGPEAATDERYGGRDWAALEADARREWDARHPSTWDRFQDAIRYGWESLTGQGAEGTHGARTMDRADFTMYGDDFRTHYVTAFGERGCCLHRVRAGVSVRLRLRDQRALPWSSVGRGRSPRPP